MPGNFSIDDRFNVTLSDLSWKGRLNYLFNKEARKRVSDLLDVVTGAFDQDRAESWLKEKIPEIDQKFPKTPLEIAASHPDLHKKMMDYINREIHWPGVN